MFFTCYVPGLSKSDIRVCSVLYVNIEDENTLVIKSKTDIINKKHAFESDKTNTPRRLKALSLRAKVLSEIANVVLNDRQTRYHALKERINIISSQISSNFAKNKKIKIQLWLHTPFTSIAG